MFTADKNGNGLIEYPGTGNFGDRPKTDRRPANWWDTINFGHEDAFANALAMRNIYIAKAQFENEGTKLHDRFHVRNRYGQKLLDTAEQEQLRLTAVLIKQFTHALTWAPDPAKALESFDQFLDLIVQDTGKKAKSQALDFLSDKRTFPVLARLLGASDFLWEDFLRRQHGNLLPLLQHYRDAPLIKPQATLRKELNRVIAKAKTDELKATAVVQSGEKELPALLTAREDSRPG